VGAYGPSRPVTGLALHLCMEEELGRTWGRLVHTNLILKPEWEIEMPYIVASYCVCEVHR
jgi:hypothetical protein